MVMRKRRGDRPDFVCPFCPIEMLSRWHFSDPETGLVICDDLNLTKHGHKHRLLCVYSGKHSRECWSREDDEMAKRKALLAALAIQEEIGWIRFSWDYYMSIPQHYHIQMNLD